MSSNDNDGGKGRDIDELVRDDPEAKRDKMGKAVHGGDQAGPNSDQGGKPQSPQTGDPNADDRRPS